MSQRELLFSGGTATRLDCDPMRWNKRGLIFKVEGQHPWMVSHAANPVAMHLADSVYRVYFASRDDINRSHIGFADVDLGSNIPEVVKVSEQPVLAPGESFEYTSGCPLTTPFGTMKGTYHMVTTTGNHFDVEIAAFALTEPYTVH